MLTGAGVRISQVVANEIGNFDFEDLAFRLMIRFANLEAEKALWASRTSVNRFAMRLYGYMQP
ncbi:hypothetical protein PTT_15955 [Pyrenophora teres f. teres 0-1]|uniref:Uncharacterized protein n=1 Tax=Pyrenophora teres f. teres (strain 0-1) TaxID=861557 RepID=E3S191_PYRTT|nr:hypothetical protein PTT_15955 [Pyrenophora teres f. teres 0-1]